MQTKAELTEALRYSTEALINQVSPLSDEQFNRKEDGHSWSPGEVLEHICKLEEGVNRIILGYSEPLRERSPDEKVDKIQSTLEDLEGKLRAGGPITPSAGHKDKDSLVARFQHIRTEQDKLVRHYNLDELCVGFKHAVFGYLTRREWIVFNIHHTYRHLEQIKRAVEVTSEVK